MKKLNNIWLTILIILAFIGFVLGMVWFFIWKKEEIPAQVIGSLFGVLVSAIVTMLLLSAQTNNEEEHEVRGKIFDQKTNAYLEVLNSLEKIIADGKIDTIRDNRLAEKEDEFSKLLFSLTRLSSFVEVKTDSKANGMNGLINAVKEIIKTTTPDALGLPDRDDKEFWNNEKKSNDRLKKYYIGLVENLEKISKFAAENLRNGSGKSDLKLAELVNNSGLFPDAKDEEMQKAENKILGSTEENSPVQEEPMDYRIGYVANCLNEMEKQLRDKFGNIERAGEGGDDIYWGRWKKDNIAPETIADWLLDRPRRGFIGYRIKVDNDFDADLYLGGDAKTFYVYIYPKSEKAKNGIKSKYKLIKDKYGPIGWWIPDENKLDETGWILGGGYGGISFDFRNASMEEAEYKDKYQKFKATAFQEIISVREDSIIKTVEELKKLLELK